MIGEGARVRESIVLEGAVLQVRIEQNIKTVGNINLKKKKICIENPHFMMLHIILICMFAKLYLKIWYIKLIVTLN